jgi:hypothetical protein
MMPDALAALRQAAEAVRAQIPTGGLTLASVERLLQAAEAVGAAAASSSPDRVNTAPRRASISKREEARQRWAEIARQNAQEVLPAPATTKSARQNPLGSAGSASANERLTGRSGGSFTRSCPVERSAG